MIKKLMVLFLILSLEGCISSTKLSKQSVNLANAYNKKEELGGYTKKQILEMFGKPNSKETHYSYNTQIDCWYYRNIYSNMKITFVNGIVTEVNYDFQKYTPISRR